MVYYIYLYLKFTEQHDAY